MFNSPKGERLHELGDKVDFQQMYDTAEKSRKLADELDATLNEFLELKKTRPLNADEIQKKQAIDDLIERN